MHYEVIVVLKWNVAARRTALHEQYTCLLQRPTVLSSWGSQGVELHCSVTAALVEDETSELIVLNVDVQLQL